ncbi:hypothetical protein EB118_01990 [bacterium]|nr:hypothetical protein [bacterium]NDC94188.1 hypothetical protein [bacterium]NDD83020.1 hypothetical protein [bacterium]NDG28858.1 hypothetical protein [bacterium]
MSASEKGVIQYYFNLHKEYASKYGDRTVVLMQMGAFYEMMGLPGGQFDIHKVASVINVNVTRSNKGIQEVSLSNPYLSGFPLASLNKYTLSLIDNGYTVVVVEQSDDNPKARKVTGVYSLGAMPLDVLDTRNCVLMTVIFEQVMSVVCIDVATSEVTVYEVEPNLDTLGELSKAHDITELVVFSRSNTESFETAIRESIDCDSIHFLMANNTAENVNFQDRFFRRVYSWINFGLISPAEYFNMEYHPTSLYNCVLALEFLESHNERYLVNLRPPKLVHQSDGVSLQLNTLHQLGIFGGRKKTDCVFNVVDHTVTAIGRRELRMRLSKPFKCPDEIRTRLNLCEAFDKDASFDYVRAELSKTVDVSKLHRKLALGIANIGDILLIAQTYTQVIDILSKLSNEVHVQLQGQLQKNVQTIVSEIQTFVTQILNVITDDKHMHPFHRGVYPYLDKLASDIQAQFDTLTGIRKVLEDAIGQPDSVKLVCTESEYTFTTTKIRMEILRKKLPKEFMDKLRIKTNSSTVKITSNEIERVSDTIKTSRAVLDESVRRETGTLVERLYKSATPFADAVVDTIALMDVCLSSVLLKRKYNYCLPQISTSDKGSGISVSGLRHPVIERISKTIYVPADVTLDENQFGMILYAINSTGKSSLLRSLGIAVILAQCGMYVPASEIVLTPFHTIASQVDMQDNIMKGQSSFVAEMSGLRRIAEVADSYTLVLSDELTKGTEHISATSIFASTVLFLKDRGAKFLFTTHLTEVSKLECIKNCRGLQICHLSVHIDNGKITFERQLREGVCDELYGLEVARATGVNKMLIDKAFQIRNGLTQRTHKRANSSKYNAKKIVESCEICGHRPHNPTQKELETHHIHFQNTADTRGFISHFHKNTLGNLVALCHKCHSELHNGQLAIHGYVQTSDGIKLQWNYV